MSTLSPSSANPSTSTSSLHPQRPPPPSLFLGPPSRNASNISLNPPAPNPSTQSHTSAPFRTRSARDPSEPGPLGRTRPQLAQTQTEGDRTDALWAEMQVTLAEVELSAFSSTHVFGAAHSAALEELREAQIALAQAWGRSEETDAADIGGEIQEEEKEGKGKEGIGVGEGEESEEGDILVARKRREANERFFARVAEGVEDVVGKLEEVAGAMGRVERESRDVWSGSESLGTTGSGTGSGSVGS